jgi:rhamnosyltransferase
MMEAHRDSSAICGVMVTYHPAEEGLRTALGRASSSLDRLIVVDNSTEAESQERIDRVVEQVGATQNGSLPLILPRVGNQGLARALNAGLSQGLREGYPLFLLLDQDSVLAPGAPAALAAAHRRLAARDAAVELAARNVEASPTGLQSRLEEIFYGAGGSLATDVRPCALAMTSGLLLSPESIRAVGPFDESLFLDAVDHEYCLRSRRRGVPLYAVPQAEIHHALGRPIVARWGPFEVLLRQAEERRLYYSTRDTLRVAARPAAPPGPESTSPRRTGRWTTRVRTFARTHLAEIAVSAFAIVFALALPFIDTGNLTRFLLAGSYLSVGRNPYTIFPYPPPPGLFAVSLPVFGVYVLSGQSLAAANFFFKLIGLAGLVASAGLLRRITRLLGGSEPVARRVQLVLLTSGAIFYVSFVWVEQDIVGIAIALAALYVLLRERAGPRRRAVEFGGLGLLGFAAFFYYFPIFLFPTLLAFGGTARDRLRRAAISGVVLLAFEGWFLLLPGWDFVTNSTGATGFSSPSPFSVLTLLEPSLFLPSTGTETALSWAFLAILILAEIAVPVLFARAQLPFVASIAIAMTLPFLLLNLSNGDEFVWPLPFLLLALVVIRPKYARGPWLWLVEAYTIPMILITNFFDSPGPGAGTGIFYLSYPQFHDATSIWMLVPDYVAVTKALAVALWLGLAGLLLFVKEVAVRPHPGLPATDSGRVASRATAVHQELPRVRSHRRPAPWVVGAVLCVVLTLVSVAVPAPTVSASASSAFPVGYFAGYPVANATSTYAWSDSSHNVVIAANLGEPSVVGSPWVNVSFSRNVASESVGFELGVGISSPAGFPYNTTILGLGASGLNVVTPFDSPSSADRLVPSEAVNVTVVNVSSAQFATAGLPGQEFNGSSYAQYDVGSWANSGGYLTVYFRWNGVQLEQNLVAQLVFDSVSYQLFGLGALYVAGEKPTGATTWTFSTGQLVKPLSWNALSFFAQNGQVSMSLDGQPISLPPSTYDPSTGAGLTLGDAGPYSDLFGRYAFEGAMVGPYATSSLPALSSPILCSFLASTGDGPACGAFATALAGEYTPSVGLTLVTSGATFVLTSPTTYFALGRLDSVGPQLTLGFSELTIRANAPLVRLVGVLDGAVAAPVLLGLMLAPYLRDRRFRGRREDG